MPSELFNLTQNETTHCIDKIRALWKKRQIGIEAPYFSLTDLASLDHHLNEQLDTLRQDSARYWATLEQRFNGPQYQSSDIFPAAVLAFNESASLNWRDFLLELIGSEEQLITTLIETLSWLPLNSIKEHLLHFLATKNPLHQRIAFTICTHHRADAGDYLIAALQSDDTELRACALRAAGEIGRPDLLPSLRQHLTEQVPEWRFWAAWSAIRVGERGQATTEILGEFSLADSPLRQHALFLLPRVLDAAQWQCWRETIKDQAPNSRDPIISIGAAGDPWQIPWLIEQMSNPELMRAAGEAFTLITGLDLVEHQLDRSTESNSINDKTPMRGLPWPDPDAITAWWQTHQTCFQRGIRYLLGHPIASDHCLHVLVNGYQRQRAAAAMELALIQTGMPLFATHTLATEQQSLLNIQDILQTCVETAAQLWVERDQAAHAPMTTLPALTELDSRLEQQLTLLREAGDLGWKCCWDNLASQKPGYIFVASATAVCHPDGAPFRQLTDHVNTIPDTVRELTAALGWVTPQRLRGRIHDLLASTSPLLRHAGITACVMHHVDPGQYMDAALKDSGLRLRARALRAVGELRLQRYLPILRQHLTHANETWRFWAAWSAGLLADSGGLDVLQQMVERGIEPSLSHQQRAVELIARAVGLESARLWIRQLLLDERFIPLVIHGLGVLGDTSAVPWLIRHMSGTAISASLAGAAFSLITGFDLIEEKLTLDHAEQTEPTDQVKLVNSLLFPRPDLKAVADWWTQHSRRFKKNRCYLMGFPLSFEVCWQVLVHGRQFQRAAATLELALLEPQTAFFAIEAPGFRQWEWLSAVGTAKLASNDTKSTVPRQHRSQPRSDAREDLSPPGIPGSSVEMSTRPYLSRKSKHPQIDLTMVGARDALAGIIRPIEQNWLFRRKLLATSPQIMATSSIEGDPCDSRMLLQEETEVIPLPEPTSATILIARNLLSSKNTQPSAEKPQFQRTRLSKSSRRGKAGITTWPESGGSPSPIILSPVTFDWYFERIAEVWWMRHNLATARYSLFSHLCEADNYLKSYLEYLPEIDKDLWKKVKNLPDSQWKAGHLFAATFIAIKNNQIQQLRKVVNIALAEPKIDQGFVSAFGWAPPAMAKHIVHLLLNSKFVKWRRLGIITAVANHIDCENFLEKLVNDADIDLNALALKAIGKLGYQNLMPILLRNLRLAHRDHRFWAAWSAVLLGNRQAALETLTGFALAPLPLLQKHALQLILRVADPQDFARWTTIVAKHNHSLQSIMGGAGACQNTLWVPWLIESMGIPEHANLAGEAFTLLTGTDLIDAGLMRPRVIHPSESQMINSIEMAQLLLPDVKAVQAWWSNNQNRYQQTTRYLLGREITIENCLGILKTGRQYQRIIAALELGLLKDKFPLLETQASSFQQRSWMGGLEEQAR